ICPKLLLLPPPIVSLPLGTVAGPGFTPCSGCLSMLGVVAGRTPTMRLAATLAGPCLASEELPETLPAPLPLVEFLKCQSLSSGGRNCLLGSRTASFHTDVAEVTCSPVRGWLGFWRV